MNQKIVKPTTNRLIGCAYERKSPGSFPGMAGDAKAMQYMGYRGAFHSAVQTAKEALGALHIEVGQALSKKIKGGPMDNPTSRHILQENINDAVKAIENLLTAAETKDQASEVPQNLVAKAQAALERFRTDVGANEHFKTIEAFVNSTKVQ